MHNFGLNAESIDKSQPIDDKSRPIDNQWQQPVRNVTINLKLDSEVSSCDMLTSTNFSNQLSSLNQTVDIFFSGDIGVWNRKPISSLDESDKLEISFSISPAPYIR